MRHQAPRASRRQQATHGSGSKRLGSAHNKTAPKIAPEGAK
jgi:hypothetical protein